MKSSNQIVSSTCLFALFLGPAALGLGVALLIIVKVFCRD
jgi:hypothetical protein